MKQTVEINNKSIALNILKAVENQNITYLFKSRHNNRENRVCLLLIENKHNIAVTKPNIFLNYIK